MSDQDYRPIPLRAKDGNIRAHAIVDPEDYEWAKAHRWYLIDNYAARHAHDSTSMRLSREIMGVTDPAIEVDHENRDYLDNRRANLRVVTHAENSQNCGPRGHNKSGYRGVHWHCRVGRWCASVRLNGKLHHLGYYDTPEDADIVAKAFRAKHMPFSSDAKEAA